MARVIGLGLGTFTVAFFALVLMILFLVSRFTRRVWCVLGAGCSLGRRFAPRNTPYPFTPPLIPRRPTVVGVLMLAIVIIVLCVSPQAPAAAAAVASAPDGLAPLLPAYLSYQTITLAVVGTILSFTAAVALCGTCGEEALELRRAKRVPA